MRSIIIIAAVAANGVIGNQGTIPWTLPGDMQHFKNTTMHRIVVMGRRTFESLPAPLVNRINIVVTSSVVTALRKSVRVGTTFRTYYLVPTWPAALALLESMSIPEPMPLYVIGGAQLYAAALPDVNGLCITHIDREYEGDVIMPDLRLDDWHITKATPQYDASSGTHFSIVHYDRG